MYYGGGTTAYIRAHNALLSTFTAGPAPIDHFFQHALLSSTECIQSSKIPRSVPGAKCISSDAWHRVRFGTVGDEWMIDE